MSPTIIYMAYPPEGHVGAGANLRQTFYNSLPCIMPNVLQWYVDH